MPVRFDMLCSNLALILLNLVLYTPTKIATCTQNLVAHG